MRYAVGRGNSSFGCFLNLDYNISDNTIGSGDVKKHDLFVASQNFLFTRSVGSSQEDPT